MSDRDQSDELQQLRAQLAELTRRVYRIEQLLSTRTADFLAAAPPASSAEQEIRSEPATSVLQPETTLVETRVIQPARRALPSSRASDSLESRIGGQWLNRLGIVAVLVGLSYFLKLAFENNWIGPATQVLIGIGAGIALLGWSERFRGKGYIGFSYSLKAVAVGALYLSLWAASQYYHLVQPIVSFFGMVLVTLTSAALSLHQNAELLAAFALVGGFLTPVLISSGQNQEIGLSCYLALLDLGTLWVAAIKGWKRLLLGAYLGTVLLFAVWAVSYYNEAQLATTLIVAGFFFLLFLATPFAGNSLPQSDAVRSATLAVVVLNAAGYFAAVYLMLLQHHSSELAGLCLITAALYAMLFRILEGRQLSEYAPVHLALGVGFLTAAIPIQLNGHWIALAWLIEAGALIWASQRSRSVLLRLLGLAATALGVVQLLAVDSEARQPLLLNPRFGLYLIAIAVLALFAHYAISEGSEDQRMWAAGAVLTLNVLALLALHFEVMDYFRPAAMQPFTAADWRSLNIARDFTYSAIWMMYGAVLMLVGFRKRSAFLRWQAIILLVLTAAKVFFYDSAALERGYRIAAFIVLGAILLAVSFFYQRSRLKSAA